MPWKYPTAGELLESYRERKVNILVKGLPPTDGQRTLARALVEMRCPVMSEEVRSELLEAVEEMNQEWVKRVIDTLMTHPKKYHRSGKCWKCSSEKE